MSTVLLPEKMDLKTLSQVYNTSDFEKFRIYIEFEDLLYDQNSSQHNEINTKGILDKIGENIQNDHFIQYAIGSILFFTDVRPKQMEAAVDLIGAIINTYQCKRQFIEGFTVNFFKKENNINDKRRLKNAIFLVKKIIPNPFLTSIDNQTEDTFTMYPIDSLEYILFQDDVDKLSNYINTNPNFSNDLTFEQDYEFYSFQTIIRRTRNMCLLDFCAFYGSIQCFKLLELNGCKLGKYILEASIAGGNIEIIHYVEQSGYCFDNCFETSIKYHHKNIGDFLLSNYLCDIFPITNCLKYYDYRAFLFFLLNHSIKIKNGITPLHYICSEYVINIDFMKFLIEKKVDINKGDSDTPLSLICSRKDVNIEALQLLLDNNVNVNDSLALNNCLNNQNITATKILIDNGADLEMSYGLFSAPDFEIDFIAFLIEQGVDVNKLHYHNAEYRITTLARCCEQSGQIEKVKFLIDNGADIDKGDITPLSFACKNNDIELIKFLLDKSPDVDKGKVTPLMYLCNNAVVNTTAMQLVIDHGADVNKGNGTTPLCTLCKRDPIPIDAVKLLLESGASTNQGDLTPVQILCSRRPINVEALGLLFKYGADANKSSLNLVYELCSPDEINLDALKLLLDNGADVNKGDITPLYLLCYRHPTNISAIKLLLDSKADVNRGNLTPLYLLCARHPTNIDTIKLLLEYGADVHKKSRTFYVKNNEMESPLAYVTKQKNSIPELFKIINDYK